MKKAQFILASSSPRRLELLSRLSIIPDKIIPADIDETELPRELPKQLALRLSIEKTRKVASSIDVDASLREDDNGDGDDCIYILGADTVAAVGRRIMPKALNDDDVRYCLELFSGKRHKIYTGITIIKKNGKELVQRHKIVESIVKFKRLTNEEIGLYIASGEGIGKAGGYTISGLAEAFVPFMSGSHSNILGLPLLETRNMLLSLGFFK